MRALAFLLFLLPAVAHAQAYEKNIYYSLPAGKTFAIRSLCQDYGGPALRALLNGDWNMSLGHNNGYCINGRTGFSFTVPPGAAMQYITLNVWWGAQQPIDWKIRIDPDCDNGPLTSCVLVSGDVDPVVTTGRFTWGGDADWYRLDEQRHNLDSIRITTARTTCVAVGDVMLIDDTQYLMVHGGPAGCAYTVSAKSKPPN